MQLWELLALLAAGAFGVGTLARSSAAASAGTAAATVQGGALGAADAALLNRAVRAAITTETDAAVLSRFSGLLRGAGYGSYADAVDNRAKFVRAVLQVHAPLANVRIAKVP